MTIKIKKLHPEAIIPSYAHEDDAGMDFYASEKVTLKPGERKIISTGISMAIPKGYVGLIWDKSGISAKNGVTTLAGVIDSIYRGEVKIVMFNTSSEAYTFEKGKKVAQMLIQSIEQKKIIEVDELEETSRGELGFGSTGLD